MSADASRPSGARLARGFAWAYLAGLALVPLTFRVIGERWWVVCVAMYLPRLGFLLPMPFVLGALAVTRQARLLVGTLVLGTLMIVFPIMGYVVGGRDEDAEKSIRVMSWNTFFGRIDNVGLHRRVTQELKPDIFVAQAIAHRTKELFRADPGGYILESDEEFLLASRYPVLDKYVPPPFTDDPHHRPNYVRYTLDTPLGPIDVFNVHPRSPRTGLDAFRGRGLRARILQGDLPDDVQPIAQNTALRRRQVEAVAAAVAAAKHPVIIAGDTNLPTQSWLYHEAFSQLRDGFSDAGSGFGYTFPTKRPWMRIDRILTDASFRFLRFTVGEMVASDHHYVLAEVTRKP